MKRFRLSTLLLLIAISALGVALVVQQQRAARREAELQRRLDVQARKYEIELRYAELDAPSRRPSVVETAGAKAREGDEE
jgi:hypothetical protein